MITPAFTVEQDENSIIITINAPHIRAQDVEIFVEGNEFKFYLQPYFLRLNLPGNIIEDDRASASYDVASGKVTARLPKETPGEHFPDLDLLTKLLARKGETLVGESKMEASKARKPLIEVIGGESIEMESGETEMDVEEGIEFDWEIPQELPRQDIITNTYYGFNSQYNGFFTHVQETMNEVNDVEDPERSTPESRRRNRIEKEDRKFDDEYYLGDFINDEEIQSALKYKTVWWRDLRRIQKLTKEKEEDQSLNATKAPFIQEVTTPADHDVMAIDMNKLRIADENESLIPFTERDQELMRGLPNKEYLIQNEKSIYLGLVDILFAYSYNHRITEGDNTVESAWTIGKLSPTISCLEQFTTLKETITACYRRALAFPLYRHYALCDKVLQDVYVLLRLGKRAALKALLETRDLLDHHDVYYVYSKVWLEDYCVWIQGASDKVVRTLAHELHYFSMAKGEMGWYLEDLEKLVQASQERQEMNE
ncbi:SHQ1 protein-domain-containing protein [Jimgerdemannia flammicorona]|uniref:SHQ1 protein-domain-containing protein n=1 Tax=Jimgerdemannia flammicorona TaxID=994334 RepID=A0A433Q340_9FUNG|nr:SHQ1 protein-domain-containing protein [Jimgerdemannia flammicorona]